MAEAPVPDAEYCRHCGAPKDVKGTQPDGEWQCAACERWQDTTACSVCGNPVRISLLPAKDQPPIAPPQTGGN